MADQVYDISYPKKDYNHDLDKFHYEGSDGLSDTESLSCCELGPTVG